MVSLKEADALGNCIQSGSIDSLGITQGELVALNDCKIVSK
jgi:hypothetical protein